MVLTKFSKLKNKVKSSQFSLVTILSTTLSTGVDKVVDNLWKAVNNFLFHMWIVCPSIFTNKKRESTFELSFHPSHTLKIFKYD
jgi:hypothetical protein